MPAHPRKLRRYYAIVLVVATASTLVLWPLLHFSCWYNDQVGAAVSSLTALAAAGGVARGLLSKLGQKEIAKAKQWIDRKLQNPNRSELALLTLGFLVFLGLFAVTGSIHFIHEGGEGAPQEVEIAVSRGNAAPFLGPFHLTQRSPSFFPKRFWTAPWCVLKVQIVRPRLWEPESVQIGWRRSVHIAFPADFRRRELTLVGLVPGDVLYRSLPERVDRQRSYYDLILRVAGKTHRIPDLQRQLIFLGDGVDEMRHVVGELKPGDQAPELRASLGRLASPPRFEPIQIRRGDRLEGFVRWSKEGEHQEWPIPSQKVSAGTSWIDLEIRWLP